jgi:hypothetical protein
LVEKIVNVYDQEEYLETVLPVSTDWVDRVYFVEFNLKIFQINGTIFKSSSKNEEF